MLIDKYYNDDPSKYEIKKSSTFTASNCRRNLKNRARLKNMQKNSIIIFKDILSPHDRQLLKLKDILSNSDDLKNDLNAQNLIYLIHQLNGAVPKNEFDVNDPINDTLYITKKIYQILNNNKTFYFFFSHYKLDDKSIYKIIPLMQYSFYKKNEFIFQEGDNSTKMYFILHGKISFRKKINSLEFDKPQEVEQFTKGEGQYFGEWDLVYGRKTKLSALCLENCYIICIGKDVFQKYIQEKFTKTESDAKANIINVLNKYIYMPRFKLERFVVSEVRMLFFKKNEIIFHEGEENRYLYLIYNGEANLLININHGEKLSFFDSSNDIKKEKIVKRAQKINYKEAIKKPISENNDQNLYKCDCMFNENNYQPVATLGNGSFAGLEIVTGVTNYKYTLISNSNFTSVYKIYLKYLDEHLKEFMINLMPLFFELEEKIHKQIDNIKFIDYNILPFYCQKYKNFRRYNKVIEYIDTNENDETFCKFIKKIEDKIDTNEGGFIKMNKYNLDLQKERNLLKNQLKENQLKDQKIDIFVKKYEQAQKVKLKYRKVRLTSSARKDRSRILQLNRTNSSVFNDNKNRPISSITLKTKQSVRKREKKENNSNEITKSNLKSANNSQPIYKIKNFNLFKKEDEMLELKNEIKKKQRKKRISLFRMPKKKATTYKIKESLFVESKELTKEVLLKKKEQNELYLNSRNSIYGRNSLKDYQNKATTYYKKISMNKKNNKNKNDNKNIFRNNIINKMKHSHNSKRRRRNNTCDEIKRFTFYNTGLFDLPLVVQLVKN